MPAETTLAHLFARAKSKPDAPAYCVKSNGQWMATSWSTYAEQIRTAARGLIALGLPAGGATAILGFNRPEWTIFDLATTLAGGVPAGIYVTSSPEEILYILRHAQAKVVLVENRDQWNKVAGVRSQLPDLSHVVLMTGSRVPDDAPSEAKSLTWEEFLARGASVAQEELDARTANLRADDPATLIYTSGTTGPPKAVMLSHRNLAWTAAISVQEIFDIGDQDSLLSYLPLSHIAEKMFTIHGSLTAGYCVYFAQAPETVVDDLREVQPSIVFGVPRVWERMYAGVRAKLGEASPVKSRLAAWAMGVARRVNDLRCRGEAPGMALAISYGLARRVVLDKVKARLGLGRSRVCASGAAPISREILEFLAGLDVLVYEVYGQSEGCGPTTFNRPGRTRLGTVGPPIPGMEVVIAADGEVLGRGPNVFLGYFKDPDATAETQVDGWLHSGDLGVFDAEGFLSITGRKKDILITSGGKNIAPVNIEAALMDDPLIADAVVLGDRRRFLAALLTLEPEAAGRFAQERGLDPAKLRESPALVAAVEAIVEKVNARFSRVQHVRRFRLLAEPFSVAGGELTPTLKLKRRVVNEKYRDLIEAMYEED